MTHPYSAGLNALREHSANRSAQTHTRITKAIRALRKEAAPINISAVARRAGVSRRTIYQHTDLAQQISALRTTGGPLRATPSIRDDQSIVGALRLQLRTQQAEHRRQLAELKAQLKQREQALAAAHGEIRRLTSRLQAIRDSSS
jgi:predicted regulator of amino acid metabolism with ACT domain